MLIPTLIMGVFAMILVIIGYSKGGGPKFPSFFLEPVLPARRRFLAGAESKEGVRGGFPVSQEIS